MEVGSEGIPPGSNDMGLVDGEHRKFPVLGSLD
jgi:hypothetical protein